MLWGDKLCKRYGRHAPRRKEKQTVSKLSAAILFPGQGSQEKNMGKDLAESSPDIMELWKRAEKACGLPLREIYWGGEDADMADTRTLQPAMTVMDFSVWMLASEKIKPLCAAGHSLGEYPALAAAEVLSIDDVLHLVSLRGKLMAEAGSDDEGMSAVLKLDEGKVCEIAAQAAADAGKELIVANFNSKGQFVLSGKKEALEKAAALVKEAKGRAVPLAVSGAFHSPLIAEAAQELKKELAKTRFSAAKFPVYFNVTAGKEADPDKIAAIMAEQMVSPVRWLHIMNAVWDEGVRSYYEMGPKGVLTRMLTTDRKGEEFTAASLSSLESIQALGEA
jgi:[acyl-carrier-protein] S-malonyltransferase